MVSITLNSGLFEYVSDVETKLNFPETSTFKPLFTFPIFRFGLRFFIFAFSDSMFSAGL